MCFDEARGVVVLFGGMLQGSDRERTWQWDGVSWSIAAEVGPGKRLSTAMAYDSERGVSILFGGYSDYYPTRLGDTWEWDGTVWTRLTDIGPPARSAHAMAYDVARRSVVLAGGGSDESTWAFGGSGGSIHMTPLYSACPGSGSGAVSWACGSPNGEVALLFAMTTGSFRVPSGPCVGTRLGLGVPHLQLVESGFSDHRGRGRIEVEHGPHACGGYIQLLDLTACSTSNTALVE